MICSIENCDKPVKYAGMCSAHHSRKLRHGDPLKGRTPQGDPLNFIEGVALRHSGDGCLLWPYGKSKKGYASLSSLKNIHGSALVCRYICNKMYGPPPTPQHESAHSCGNGHSGCVNPAHLSWRTRAENIADKFAHGTTLRGGEHPFVRLSENDVRTIRSLKGKIPQSEVARRFRINQGYVCQIQNRKRWGWLD